MSWIIQQNSLYLLNYTALKDSDSTFVDPSNDSASCGFCL